MASCDFDQCRQFARTFGNAEFTPRFEAAARWHRVQRRNGAFNRLQRPGAVLSRTQLEDRLYGWTGQIESNAVEVYVHGLRRKLGSDSIRTLRGVGYYVPK